MEPHLDLQPDPSQIKATSGPQQVQIRPRSCQIDAKPGTDTDTDTDTGTDTDTDTGTGTGTGQGFRNVAITTINANSTNPCESSATLQF